MSFADVVEYDTDQREQWFTDVGGAANVSTVDFTGYPAFTPVTDQWDHLGINFSGEILDILGPSEFLFPNDGWGLNIEPSAFLTFDSPINWIAADFPGTLAIELYLGELLVYASDPLAHGGTGNFAGLISDEPFDRARISDPIDSIVLLDDLFFGPPITVPAPGVLIMMLGAALVRRRRRG